MSAILRNFVTTGGFLSVIDKSTKKVRDAGFNDKCFLAHDAWSNEIEEAIGSQKIEKKALAQIRRVINGESICDHQALNDYDLFWKVRHRVKDEKSSPYQMFNGSFGDGSYPEDSYIARWCNVKNHVLVRPDGTISGKDSLSQQIKNTIENDVNTSQYENTRWQVFYSADGKFVSADCYKIPIIPISPFYILGCVRKSEFSKSAIKEDEKGVHAFNEVAWQQCQDFWFCSKEWFS